jgi:S-adenosylmethionine:tRNA ribosyltransferase-isomerase
LPADRVAQSPAEPRDSSRMLVVHRRDGRLEHRHFRDIVEYAVPGDVVVVNATSVFRARLLGTRETGGGAPAEVFLLREVGPNRFEALVHPGGKLRPGRRIRIADDLVVVVEQMTEQRTRIVRLETHLPAAVALERHGHVPLPPYITRPDTRGDEAAYQTIFARHEGSVAAPTAGLHFSAAIVEALLSRGVKVEEIVLHVGAGTFRPVRVEDPAEHRMHEEWYSISERTAAELTRVRAAGGKIHAVGTTVLRTLESNWLRHGKLLADSGETNLFVRPPFTFNVVDHLLTNFHLPRSTLLMLVAAFAGYELTMHAYEEAIRAGYRFYSYGDAMLIL